MKKFITVLGARPQFIKASSLSKLISEKEDIEEIIIHTGQHFDYQMSDIFFKELNIPNPKYNLNIHSLPHGAMTGRMVEEIEKILIQEKPDLLIVYGDTNSTLSGALAASKLHIPIAHIEAGLRSFNKMMPEETNRKITDHISDYCFCPNNNSAENLRREGIINSKIFKVGDIMYDNFLTFKDLVKKQNIHRKSLKVTTKSYCLVTLHREENTKDFDKLFDLFIILKKISDVFGYIFIFPMHPRLKLLLEENKFQFEEFKNIVFTEPVSYFSMIDLELNSKMILTDSGGVQKEAYWSEVPCLTLREETEWIELVEIGINKIVALNSSKIYCGFRDFLNLDLLFPQNLYGDGKTGQKILDIILTKNQN